MSQLTANRPCSAFSGDKPGRAPLHPEEQTRRCIQFMLQYGREVVNALCLLSGAKAPPFQLPRSVTGCTFLLFHFSFPLSQLPSFLLDSPKSLSDRGAFVNRSLQLDPSIGPRRKEGSGGGGIGVPVGCRDGPYREA